MKVRLLILCLALQALPSWGTESLRLATSEWPPFTGKTSDRHIAEDLVELALRKAGVDFTVQIEEWNIALAGAQAGDYDGLVAAWYSEQRARTLKFSKPILENRILAVTLADRAMSIDSVAALAQLSVGKIAGYTYGEELDGTPVAKQVEYKHELSALSHLLAGEVDAVLIDDLSLRYQLREMPHEQQQRFSPGGTLAMLSLHFALDKRLANAPAIISSFNRAIEDMVVDGTYNQVLDLPWVVVDTDNDGVHEYIASGAGLDLSVPPGDNQYQVYRSETSAGASSKRVYRVGGRQYGSWQEAREAIIDEYQSVPSDRMIQDNRYTIGVPL